MTLLILFTSLSLIVAYLIGSIPSAYLIGKYFKKIDIREHGSGNVGATNALRVLGPKLGVLVLLCDVIKGVLAIYTAQYLQQGYGEWFVMLSGLAVIIGHMFTLFLGFKGGKGVATATGVCAAIMPLAFVSALVVFIAVVALTRYVSLGSILAVLMLSSSKYIQYTFTGIEFKSTELTQFIFCIIITIIIIVKHLPNIVRLFKGTENKISFNKK